MASSETRKFQNTMEWNKSFLCRQSDSNSLLDTSLANNIQKFIEEGIALPKKNNGRSKLFRSEGSIALH